MQQLHNSPVVGWLFPSAWQEEMEDIPTTEEMARRMAELDAASPEEEEALFYGLLDLTDEQIQDRYRLRSNGGLQV